jgi:hypothetical protein
MTEPIDSARDLFADKQPTGHYVDPGYADDRPLDLPDPLAPNHLRTLVLAVVMIIAIFIVVILLTPKAPR